MAYRMDNLPWEFNFEEETQWEGDYFLDSFIEHLQRSMRIQCGEYDYRLWGLKPELNW